MPELYIMKTIHKLLWLVVLVRGFGTWFWRVFHYDRPWQIIPLIGIIRLVTYSGTGKFICY